MNRALYHVQQITLNERGLVALCLGLILLVCFISKTTMPLGSYPKTPIIHKNQSI
ncbi:MAG: hypothetical protein HFP77_05015 [Methylococcales symbiont of Iophon sp. n. MRB-2018]|nr:MAG: hypothetical protein HFP77_05015 [Methylococcales symbiont of Iophon sp. n. MRB-2018]